MPRLLMCPPEHYQVVYEINPWMSRARPADRKQALEQWRALRALLARLGAEIAEVGPQPGLPDMVFTANAGLVCGPRVVVSRFRHFQRQGEAAHFETWFREEGWEVIRLPEGLSFEGEGDALFVGDTLFAGYYFRSDARSHAFLSEALGVRVLSLQLVDPHFYHLDTCFCPLDAETVAWYPPAFDGYARAVVESNVPRRIVVEPDEARRFACNAVVLGDRVVLNTGCPAFERSLEAIGKECHATSLFEFLKAGGSAKCLTLHLDRPCRAASPAA